MKSDGGQLNKPRRIADNQRRFLADARARMTDTFPAACCAPTDAASWHHWVGRFAELLQAAPEGAAPPTRPRDAKRQCLVFAPHPDDECIVGALPLRLQQESGWQVTVVAVTLGSQRERRAARRAELGAACAHLGFELLILGDEGLERVRPDTADAEPALWRSHLDRVVQLLTRARPALVLAPHGADANATHIGVHLLIVQALAQARYAGLLAQTEFWAPQAAPNCMVQTSIADTARLVQALACHVGEVARNPYHLRLPAWMADNVRRGGELIAGAGSEPPRYAFATLYGLSRWADGAWQQDLTPMFCDSATALEL